MNLKTTCCKMLHSTFVYFPLPLYFFQYAPTVKLSLILISTSFQIFTYSNNRPFPKMVSLIGEALISKILVNRGRLLERGTY